MRPWGRLTRRGAAGVLIALAVAAAPSCTLTTSLDGLTGGEAGDAAKLDASDAVADVKTEADTGTGQSVDAFTLVNTNDDTDVGALTNGETLSRKTLPANFAVRATTTPSTVGSVAFLLDGTQINIEGNPPYYVVGDDLEETDIVTPWVVTDGSHTLKAVPYTGTDGTGDAGKALQVMFTIGP